MKKLLLKLVLSKNERKAVKILTDIYYPVIEKETSDDAIIVKQTLEKLKVTFK
jgi:hypothetical protein